MTTLPDDVDLAASVRARRNICLRECDWTVGADAPLTPDQVTAWKDYRQALRDIPTQSGFPDTVDWPAMPVA